MTFALLLLAFLQTSSPSQQATQILNQLLEGKYQALYDRFTPQMKQGLPVSVMEKQVGPSIRALGAVKKVGEPREQKIGANTLVLLPVDFAQAAIYLQFTIDASGRIAGLYLRPREAGAAAEAGWRRPAYSDPKSFRERAAIVGSGEWKLPGTLLVPAREGKSPAVVLVHGSGPNDRDETIGPNKVFRDLAEGLASRGIAVLRYEKRTREHGAKMLQAPNATVKEETVDDAVDALTLVRAQPEVDPRRVFVLGHSLGAYLSPRIAKQDGALAGMIAMAGNTRPLEDLLVEQVEYLTPIQGGSKEQVDQLKRQVEEVKRLKPGERSGLVLMGMPAAYLLDLRGYQPAAVAASLDIPVLVLQGERDYQVSMADFDGWRKALAGREAATLKSYPSLNHLFMQGQGKSTPSEYAKEGHVAPEVIDDLAKWISSR